jgi:hypothetical protein
VGVQSRDAPDPEFAAKVEAQVKGKPAMEDYQGKSSTEVEENFDIKDEILGEEE